MSVFAKISAMTRAQYLRMAQEHESRFGPDSSAIVRRLPNGWTIRKPQTFGDLHREGTLMSNCFAAGAWNWSHDDWDPHETPHVFHEQEVWENAVRPPLQAQWRTPPESWGGTPYVFNEGYGFDTPLPEHAAHSLRDPDNLPHATFLHPANWSDHPPLGRHNGDLSPEYQAMVDEFTNSVRQASWNSLMKARRLSMEIPDLSRYRNTGECYLCAEALARDHPRFRQESGFYVHPQGPLDHSWNVAPDGTIVDPTASQFGEHPEVIPPDHPLYSRYQSYESHPDEAMSAAHQSGWHFDQLGKPLPDYLGICPDCA